LRAGLPEDLGLAGFRQRGLDASGDGVAQVGDAVLAGGGLGDAGDGGLCQQGRGGVLDLAFRAVVRVEDGRDARVGGLTDADAVSGGCGGVWLGPVLGSGLSAPEQGLGIFDG
jgi:hypothetical protein